MFCLLTPQARGKAAWEAVLGLRTQGLLLQGEPEDLLPYLRRVRFHRKAWYVVEARKFFWPNGKPRVRALLRPVVSDPPKGREWLVRHVRGMGYKEASHFLRNLGFGENLAILDRHILRNLLRLGVIADLPTSLTPKRYLEIEQQAARFARQIGIPLSHLDLLLWYRETGEVFK